VLLFGHHRGVAPGDEGDDWAVTTDVLSQAYWEYYRLSTSGARADRLAAENSRWAAEEVNRRVIEDRRHAVQLLLSLCAAAPDLMALSYLGAGPVEDLLRDATRESWMRSTRRPGGMRRSEWPSAVPGSTTTFPLKPPPASDGSAHHYEASSLMS
jgi:hypothetical protein